MQTLYKFVSLNYMRFILSRNIIFGAILVLVILISSNCAKQGSPSGGPKDEDPPKVVESKPGNYAMNYNEQDFRVEFDEYIQLENIIQELLVSPPMKEKPIVKLRGKIIDVEYEDTLKENTTYTFNFGNAIVDNHERNPLENFEFVFSTGDYLDSLSVRGTLVNSFNHKPSEEPIYVMLYENLNDSAPLLEIPYYINRSNKEGYYSINNVKNGDFRLFALKDANNNLMFDLPSEIIAFEDSVITLSGELYNKLQLEREMMDTTAIISDSIPIDTAVFTDSLQVDSLPPVKHKNYAFHIDMHFFEQEAISQYISNTDRLKKYRLGVTFNSPLKKPIEYKLLNEVDLEDKWCIIEDEYARDTLIYWITDTAISNRENIMLEFIYLKPDSNETWIPYHDTVSFRFVERKVTRKKKKDEEEEEEQVKKEKLGITFNIKNSSTMELNGTLEIYTSHPIDSVDESKIQMYVYHDTLEIPCEHGFIQDTIEYPRKFTLPTQWEEGNTYKVQIFPSAFQNIYNLEHDTIALVFIVRKMDYYGAILVNLSDVSNPIIMQLTDKNENVLYELSAFERGTYKFEYLLPKEYTVKLIEDKNGNGKWDTGNYLKKLQPDKVKFYPEVINVRSNWDVEIELDGKF